METEIENTWKELITSFISVHPTYHLVFEICLILSGLFLYFRRSYKPTEGVRLTKKEEEELIAEWECEPLVPPDWKPDPKIQAKFEKRCVTGPLSKDVILDYSGKQYKLLNFSSFNFFNLIGNEEIRDAALNGLQKYGVGSCGPRGFYGTFDAHLRLEEELAEFLGCEESVVYSYGFSTIASAIPAYSKRGDIIYTDEGVSFAVQCGLIASRSKIRYFRHNDMEHLEQLLQEELEEDTRNPAKANVTRKFIVVESIYVNYGDFCPLAKLVELKYKYKVRIFLDETMSIGVLGRDGRGLTEHQNVDTDDIDLITGSLETAIATCGGFSVGSKFVVDHQRLSSQGYCFSASLPPLLACGASTALRILQSSKGKQDRVRLAKLSKMVSDMFSDGSVLNQYWHIEGNEESPIKHIRLINNNTEERLESAVCVAEEHGLMLTVARYLKESEHKLPLPSIRVSLNCALTDDDMNQFQIAMIAVGKQLDNE